MTLSEIKREVRALKRKYAAALAVVRLRRAAREFCDEWEATRENGKSPLALPSRPTSGSTSGIPPEGPPFLHGLHQPLQEDQRRPIAYRHRQGPYAVAVLPPHHRKPGPPRVLLRAPSGSQRSISPPRHRGRIPHHDLEPPQPRTHTRITRQPYDLVTAQQDCKVKISRNRLNQERTCAVEGHSNPVHHVHQC